MIEYHRQSIRLQGYDYAQQGLYFVTICTQHRLPLLGAVVDGIMHCNDAGKMIDSQWREMTHKFPNIALHEFVVMPNHIHGIIEILDINPVGANLCVRPDMNDVNPNTGASPLLNKGAHIGFELGTHIGAPLHQMMQWFKTMTTNAYIRGVKMSDWKPFDGKLWQRNYYEHIIRNQQAHDKISQYITNNPAQWQRDTYFDE